MSSNSMAPGSNLSQLYQSVHQVCLYYLTCYLPVCPVGDVWWSLQNCVQRMNLIMQRHDKAWACLGQVQLIDLDLEFVMNGHRTTCRPKK